MIAWQSLIKGWCLMEKLIEEMKAAIAESEKVLEETSQGGTQ